MINFNPINKSFKRQSQAINSTPTVQFKKPEAVLQNKSSNAAKGAMSHAYFHPSFCGEIPSIKQLAEFVDYAVANPKDIDYVNKNLVFGFRSTILKMLQSGKSMGFGSKSEIYRLSENHVLKADYYSVPFLPAGFKIPQKTPYDALKTWYGRAVGEIFNLKILKNVNPEGKAIQAGAPYEMSRPDEIANIYK